MEASKIENKNKLTIKQEKFCLEFAQSGNAAESYIKAGFNVKNVNSAAAAATRLLKNVKVQGRLREIQQETADAEMIDIREYKKTLTRIIRQQLTDDVVTMKGEKLKVRNSVRETLKAMELWGKMNGIFISKQELDIQGVVPVVLTDDVKD